MTHAEQTQLTIVAICTVVTIALMLGIPYLYSKRKNRPRTPFYDKAIANK